MDFGQEKIHKKLESDLPLKKKKILNLKAMKELVFPFSLTTSLLYIPL